jgi:uncharacterized protein (DUF427 family)
MPSSSGIQRRRTFLYETRLPRRSYLPRLDVRVDLFTLTARKTGCRTRGKASYWSLVTPHGEHTGIAWSYPTPLREPVDIAGLLAFYDHRVDLTIDGQLHPRPAR